MELLIILTGAMAAMATEAGVAAASTAAVGFGPLQLQSFEPQKCIQKDALCRVLGRFTLTIFNLLLVSHTV